VFVGADSRDVANLDMRIPSESVDQAAVHVQELTSGLLGVQVIVETQDDLTSLVVDSEQELVLLLAVRKRNNGCGCDVQSVEAVDDAHVQTTGSGEMLEVGTVLRRGLGLGNNILESDTIVRKIGDQNIFKYSAKVLSSSIVVRIGSMLAKKPMTSWS